MHRHQHKFTSSIEFCFNFVEWSFFYRWELPKQIHQVISDPYELGVTSFFFPASYAVLSRG